MLPPYPLRSYASLNSLMFGSGRLDLLTLLYGCLFKLQSITVPRDSNYLVFFIASQILHSNNNTDYLIILFFKRHFHLIPSTSEVLLKQTPHSCIIGHYYAVLHMEKQRHRDEKVNNLKVVHIYVYSGTCISNLIFRSAEQQELW